MTYQIDVLSCMAASTGVLDLGAFQMSRMKMYNLQGDTQATEFYVVEEGVCDCFVKSPGGRSNLVLSIGSGG